jgi:hypothetical protein
LSFMRVCIDDAPLPAAMPNLCRFGRRIAGFLPSK